MKLYKLTPEEIKAIKAEVVEQFAQGKSVGEMMEITGIDRSNFDIMKRDDLMFGHHISQAKARAKENT